MQHPQQEQWQGQQQMMPQQQAPPVMEFKFRFIDEDGNQMSIMSKKGGVTQQELYLDDQVYPMWAILIAKDVSETRLGISYITPDGGIGEMYLEAHKQAKELVLTLNGISSEIRARREWEELSEQGKENAFRSVACPNCRATVTLSEHEPAHYAFCHYCDFIFPESGHHEDFDDEVFTFCRECGLFAPNRRFFVFQFYFLLVLYGVSYRHMMTCPSCARSEAWWSLVKNLLFVIGIPFSVVMLFKAYSREKSQRFQGLVDANSLALDGKYMEATQTYQQILSRVPDHPGILYNIGQAHIVGGDYGNGVGWLEHAVKVCPSLTMARDAAEEAHRMMRNQGAPPGQFPPQQSC